MSGNQLNTSLKITADARGVVAAAKESREHLLRAFADAKKSAVDAAQGWKAAEAEVKRLAVASRAAGGSQVENNKALSDAAAAKAKAAYQAASGAVHENRKALTDNAATIREATAALEKQVVAEKRLAETRKLSAARERLDVRPFREIDREIKAVEAAYKRLAASGKASSAELAQAQLKVIERTQELRAQKNGLLETFAQVKASVIALAAAFAVLASATREAISIEVAMAELDKFADFKTPADMEKFRDLLQDLALDLPYTTEQLALLAAAGAQMGIPTGELEEFVRLAGSMGVAFQVGAEDAGRAAGLLMNIFKLNLSQMKDLADTINHLGDQLSNVAEKDIVTVMTRLGGLAKTFGLTERQTAALSAAMLSMGKSPEVASTALSSLLTKLATLPTAEPKARAAFEKLGLSADEFATKIKTDPQAALQEFLETLESVPKSLRLEVLAGFNGAEYADDIALLVEGLDNYRNALELANDEARKGTMQKEAEKQAASARAELAKAAEAVRNLGAAIGDAFLPILKPIAQGLQAAAAGARDFVRETGPMVPLIAVVGGLAIGMGALRTAMAAAALAAAATGWVGLAATLTKVGAVMVMLPFAKIIAGLALLAAAWYGVKKAVDYFSGNRSTAELTAEEDALKKTEEALKKNARALEALDRQIKALDAAGLDEVARKLRALRETAKDGDIDFGAVEGAARQHAERVLALHGELRSKQGQLDQEYARLAAVESGKIVQTEKERIAAQIRELERLKSAREKDLNDAEQALKKYADAVSRWTNQAAADQVSTADKIRELRRRDMSESAQQADIQAEAFEKIGAARKKLSEATQAAARGDYQAAEKAAEASRDLAKQAEGLGGSLKDTGAAIRVVSEAGSVLASSAKSMSEVSAKAFADTQKEVERLKKEVEDLDAKMKDLKTEGLKIEIKSNIDKLTAEIEPIQKKLDDLKQKETIQILADGGVAQAEIDKVVKKLGELPPKAESRVETQGTSEAVRAIGDVAKNLNDLNGKTATTYVVTEYVEKHSAGGPAGGVLKLNRGGKLPGYGGGDRISALLEAGEYVVRKERAAKFGALVHMINTAPMALLEKLLGGAGVPRFALGGPVTSIPSFSLPALPSGGSVPGATSRDVVDVNLNIGRGRFPLQTSRDVATGLARALQELSRG